MARAPKSPLVAIIAYFMNATIDAARQALETAKTIIHEREQAGLREPVLPLKPGKKAKGANGPTPGALRAKAARDKKKKEAAVATGGSAVSTAPAGTTTATSAIAEQAKAQSPRKRPRAVPPVNAAAPLVDPAPAGLPDQAVDPTHDE